MSAPAFDQPPTDQELSRLLAEAKSHYSPNEAKALARGAAAAPEGESAIAWTRLVAPQPSAELAQALVRLKNAAVAQLEESRETPVAQRLARLRMELAKRNLSGFIVPRADEHQGEYVPLRAQRLAWISGFTGSAGVAIVLQGPGGDLRRRALYGSGARRRPIPSLFQYRHLIEEPASRVDRDQYLKPGDRARL